MTMKITKSKLKQIIKEEIKSLDQISGVDGAGQIQEKYVRVPQIDQNWIQKLLGFKSEEADQIMSRVRRYVDDAEQHMTLGTVAASGDEDNRPFGDTDSLHGYAPDGFSRQVALLRRLPDKAQRAKGKKASDKYRDISRQLRDYIDAELDEKHASNAAKRAAREKWKEQEERRRQEEEWAEDAAKEAARKRKASSSGVKRNLGGEWHRDSDLDWDEDISRLEESKKLTKRTLKRVIAEEIKLLKKEKAAEGDI